MASIILSIWFPVFTFTSIGFEHSIANMFYVDIGLFAGGPSLRTATSADFLWRNLVPVTLGNFVGGALMLGTVGWLCNDAAALRARPKGERGTAEHGRGVEPLHAPLNDAIVSSQ